VQTNDSPTCGCKYVIGVRNENFESCHRDVKRVVLAGVQYIGDDEVRPDKFNPDGCILGQTGTIEINDTSIY